jgi:hypothetical protein
MHGWFSWGHTVWMTIAWLTAVGLLLTLVWSIVLSAVCDSKNEKV